MKRIAFAATLILSSVLVYTGCSKPEEVDTETTSSTDNSLCEQEFLRVLPTVNKIAIDEPGVHRLPSNNSVASNCPVITVLNPNAFPVDMVIDYGTGCTDSIDGKVRKGRINVRFSMPWDSVGCVMTAVLDSFFVGAIQYEGTCVLTRTSATGFTQEVTNGKCTRTGSNPWEILWATNKTIEWTEGVGNSSANQKISVYGTNTGTDRTGKTFTCTVSATDPIIRSLNCPWITKGKVTLTPEGRAERLIDFGDGSCDNRATVTIDGNTFEFTMN